MGPETTVIERGVVCRVTMNRPGSLNALNEDVRRDLQQLCDELRDDPHTRVLVMRGAGRAFSAGADLKAARAVPEPDWSVRRFASGAWQRLLSDLEALPQVSVAELRGHVVGGGVLLALSCDLRIGSPDLRVLIPEVALGLPLTWAGLLRMVRELGLPITRDLVMTGRALDAPSALACGFVQRLAPDLDLGAQGLIDELLAMPPGPLAMTRAALAALSRHVGAEPLSWADPDLIHWSSAEPESREAGRAYVARRIGDT